MSPEEAVKVLSIGEQWFNAAAIRPGEMWQVLPREYADGSHASQPYDPGKLYGVHSVHMGEELPPPLEDERAAVVNGVMTLGLLQKGDDVSLVRFEGDSDEKFHYAVDYAALPAEKISFARIEEMNGLCQTAVSSGMEEMGHLLGYPEFICWAPENPRGKLVLDIDYSYGGGVRRDRLSEVVEKLWKPLGLTEVQEDRHDFRDWRSNLGTGAAFGAGYYCLSAGEGYSEQDTRPRLFINLEHPGIMANMRSLLDQYRQTIKLDQACRDPRP